MSAARSVTSFGDTVAWVGVLFWVSAFSFITARYDSQIWLTVSAAFYVYLAIVAVAAVSGWIRVNTRGLRRAKTIILLLGASIAWLGLQLLSPLDLQRLPAMQQSMWSPDWFNPRLMTSYTPEKSIWLMLSSCFVLSWVVLVIALTNSRSRLKQLLWALTGIALLHSAVGVFAMHNNLMLVDPSQVDGHFHVARGWYVNRNHYASLLLTAGCGGLAVFIHTVQKNGLSAFWSNHKTVFILITLAFLLVSFAIIYSESRAGLLAPVIAVGATLLIARLAGIKLPMRALVRVGLLVGIVMIALLLSFGEGSLQRLQNLSVGERLLQWRVTLEAIGGSPWTGFGGGSYATVFQASRGFEEFRQVVYNQAHNQYLHVWLEQGLIGLLLWLAVIWCAIKSAFNTLKSTRSKLEQAVILAALIALISACVQAMVDFNLQIVNLRLFFFLWVALIIVAHDVHKRSEKNSAPISL